MKELRVALVHDWLVSFGGSEQVLLELVKLFPSAPIYTSLYDPNKLPDAFKALNVTPSFLQKIPGALARHRLLLPLMPLAFEQFDFNSFDLVISSSHACAKGIITSPSTCHISYVHSPIRYAWDMYHHYLEAEKISRFKKPVMAFLLHYLRLWDQLSSMRVDRYSCNSTFVQQRIKKYYRREAKVIHPPVEMNRSSLKDKKEPYYLVFSRLVSYKRIELAIEGFNLLGIPLKVIGDGPCRASLEKLAKPNIEFLGYVSAQEKWDYLSSAKALIFPGIEDFGIIPVEAMAVGCPVIAFSQGGVLDSVVQDLTGIFFHQQSVESLKQAVLEFESKVFEPLKLRQHAQHFSQQVFQDKMVAFVENTYHEFLNSCKKLK